ncbi:LysM peptidoglycan-binding domain-containing protein [[Clostridium] symbiosum]|uniref:LysM peptidoglycan-binding domain-containing protein n=1 Tax=Clostridium symbiosum TaxID=1512 RepID=UPI001D08EA36|nr:LysM peptidoglycan-binding domain-containing protein [[Clostridium] symbiosum]MCB6610158.1 LysM peptidoglycan-binding domain-containing protein [[Clostridium] symbiosum]MCB6933494.1 LysM peptidoglycan-binding domain-containing protein [[Clostridium] symbiosum]
MYEIYIDDMRLPITPQKIQMKYGNQNKTVELINGEEFNIIRPPGLCEVSLDAVIPQSDYPFAVWDGAGDAEEFIEHLRELKEARSEFEFIVIREGPGRQNFFDTNMDVTLEDYKISDDVKEGVDLLVSLTLKEYQHYGTKIMNFTIMPEQTPQATETEEDRAVPETPKTYTVQGGDSLWKIAKKTLGDGSRWSEIYNLNTDKIGNPDLIYPGQVLTLP